MTKEQSESSPGSESVPVYVLPCIEKGEEVSIIDFFRVLARHKLVVLGVFLLVFTLAIGYLYVKVPIYTVSARLVPPDIADIKGLLLLEPRLWWIKTEDDKLVGYTNEKSLLDKYGLEAITPASVFKSYVKNCNSEEVRRRFSDPDNSLGFKLSTVNNNNPAIDISISHRDPEYAANKLNEFIDFVDRDTTQKIIDNIKQIIEIEVKKLSRDLDMQLIRGVKDQVNINSEDVLLDVELLQKRINYLNSLSVDLSNISVVNVDNPAQQPSVPDKSNKSLIILLSIALGVLLGVLSAFIKDFVDKSKKASSNTT